MDLTIIIVNYNSGLLLQRAVGSIIEHTKSLNYEIIMVDNASSDESFNLIKDIDARVIKIRNEINLGFAKANNIGIKRAKGKVILLLNQDVRIEGDVFGQMYKYLIDDRSIGILGCKIIYPDGRIQTSAYSYTSLEKQLLQLILRPFRPLAPLIARCDLFKNFKPFFYFGKIIGTHFSNYASNSFLVEVDCITGACMMFRREIIDKVGLLDELFFMYYEDEDYCRRVKIAGFKIIHYSGIAVIHDLGWGRHKLDISLIKERQRSFNYYCKKYYESRFIYYAFYKTISYFLFQLYLNFVRARNAVLNLSKEKDVGVSRKINICNVNIDNVSIQEALEIIKGLIEIRRKSYITTPNVDHIIKLKNDLEFKKIYENASLVLADGMPLIWASKFLGTPLKEKISGSDLVPEVCKLAAKKGYRLFFLGGRSGTAQGAKERLEGKFPSIKIVGVYAPPFGFENYPGEDEKIVKLIKESSPDILLVGLGTPKQEKWIYRHYKELNVPVSIGVGATFDFIAGVVKRAPRWMQRTGLEWLWRLMMEPHRLWKRYLIDDMKFFLLVLLQKLERKR